LHTHASSCTIHHFILTSFPAPEKREREKEEKGKGKKKGITGIQGVLFLLPSQAIGGQDWTPSKVTQGHLQSLVKQGFMKASKLVACRVSKDPSFPAPAEGYMVTFVAYYE
jgi:hypothetical protein